MFMEASNVNIHLQINIDVVKIYDFGALVKRKRNKQ